MKGGSQDCGVDEGPAVVDPRGALRQRLPDADGPPRMLIDQDGYGPAPASSGSAPRHRGKPDHRS
jgi:hypothetical protein